MPVYTFNVVIDHYPTDEEFDALYEATSDDVNFETGPEQTIAIFDREAAACADAVVSAIADLEKVGLRPLRFVDEDLLTLADIADRIGRSRECVRRYSIGARGPGGFPPPVNPGSPGNEGTTFYRWSEVAPWLRERMGIDAPDREPALVMANNHLELRENRRRTPHAEVLDRAFAALPPPAH